MKRFSLIIVLSSVFCDVLSQEMIFTSIEPVPKIKRGREYEVNWQGGSREDVVSIILVDKRGREVVVANSSNTGKAAVRIPSRTRPGSYSIKVMNQVSGESTPSGQLRIKRRIPLALQIAPFVVVPLAIILISDGKPVPEMPMYPNPYPDPD